MNAPLILSKDPECAPDIALASIQIADASRYLAMSSALELNTPGYQGWAYREAIKRLHNVADSLGFDLVKREPTTTQKGITA